MTTVAFPLYSEGLHRKLQLPVEGFGHRFCKEQIMNDVDSVGGYSVPVDPMDDLQCESCQ